MKALKTLFFVLIGSKDYCYIEIKTLAKIKSNVIYVRLKAMKISYDICCQLMKL